jgi:hypothetical protein
MKIRKMKLVSILVMSSIVAPGFSAFASGSLNDGQTPEARLIESTLVAQGRDSNPTATKEKTAFAVQQYFQESQSESDAERTANLEQAWVNFQVMTPAQAHEEAMELSQAASQSKNMSDVISATTSILANSKGAQFSGCLGAGITAGVLGVGGVVVEAIGAVKSDDTTATGTREFPDGVPTSEAAAPMEAAGIVAIAAAFTIGIVAFATNTTSCGN